jgi:succinyl-diaminopimelate desuccinylase
VTVYGKQGHSAYPDLADNPLPRLGIMVAALSEYQLDEGNAHFPASNLEITSIDVGNKADNVIPAEGTFKFNVRFNTEWTAASLEQKIHDVLTSVDKNFDLDIYKCNAHPFLTAPGEWTVAQMASIPALLLGAWLWLSAPDRKAAAPDQKASSAPTSG